MKKILLLSIIFFISIPNLSLKAQSNLFIDTTYTVEEMVADFFNHPNISISNIEFTGDSSAFAFFDAGNTDLEIDAGILFTNGRANDVDASADVSYLNVSNLSPGDPDLDLLFNISSYNATIIEFDFELSQSDTIQFKYIFGSEEYPEYTCSSFNDGFAFFISGPGISGPFSNNAINICTIPDTTASVTINNINDNPACGADEFEQYYIDNSLSSDIVYDGMTTALPALFYAMAGNSYHAKLAIGDAGDAVFDSGIFLSFASLSSDTLLIPPSQFEMILDQNTLSLENQSKYATDWQWDFGNGDISYERNPTMVEYDLPGIYTISLTTYNYCCSNTYTQEIEILADALGIEQLEKNEISFYPNPARDKIFLENVADVKDIMIFDIQGISYPVEYKSSSEKIEINLPEKLTSGIYFLQVINRDQTSRTMRLMIEN